MNSKNFILDFTIPQGPTGPIGPANGLNAYGGKYNYNTKNLNLEKDKEVIVPLEATLISHGIEYDTENSITIITEGVYEINYRIEVTTTSDATITTLVKENNSEIAPSGNSKILSGGTITLFTGNTIYPLEKDGIVNLVIMSNSATEATINIDANLIVKRID